MEESCGEDDDDDDVARNKRVEFLWHPVVVKERKRVEWPSRLRPSDGSVLFRFAKLLSHQALSLRA